MWTRERRFALACGLGLTLCGEVAAETRNCIAVPAVPHTIAAPGVYCLTRDLRLDRTSGIAIRVDADDVVLDLNGHLLDGVNWGVDTEAAGVFAMERRNLTIRNGTVRGFRIGIWLSGRHPYTAWGGHQITDIRADQNRSSGIRVDGRGSIVERNLVVDTVATAMDAGAWGIYVLGPGNRVVDNDIVRVRSRGNAFAGGIRVENLPGNLVVSNRVSDVAYGIWFDGDGEYRDNLTTAVETRYVGGTDVGNNN